VIGEGKGGDRGRKVEGKEIKWGGSIELRKEGGEGKIEKEKEEEEERRKGKGGKVEVEGKRIGNIKEVRGQDM
jgi:hypothetical protein